jgi:hypothetical protein
MNAPAVNIVVSFAKEPMDRLFTGGATFKNLIAGLTDEGNEDVLLFNHENNPNIVSLKHTLGKGGNIIELDMIDPMGVFEARFMTDNTVDMMGGYLKKGQTLPKPNPLNKAKETDQKTELESKKGFQKKFQQSFQKAYGKRYLYIAYGVGDNLDLWSGPHMMLVIGADIVVKGPKKIKLRLSAIQSGLNVGSRKGMYNEQVHLNLEGLSVEVDAHSKSLDFTNLGTDNPVYAPTEIKKAEAVRTKSGTTASTYEDEVLDLMASEGLTLVQDVVKQVDIHLLVTDVIRKFIKKATGNPNVIVLLPNLNLICRDTIEEIAKYEKLTSPEGGGSGDSNTANSILESEWLSYNAETSYLGLFYNTVKHIIHRFCMSMDSFEKDTNYYKNVLGSQVANLMSLVDQDAAIDPKQRFDQYIKDRNHFAAKTYSTDDSFPDYEKEVKTIVTNIFKTSQSQYKSNIQLIYESDTKLINYWVNMDNEDLPLFCGIGEKLDPEIAPIIYGDMQLIRDYLYGQTNIQQKRAQIEEMKSEAVNADAVLALGPPTAATQPDFNEAEYLAAAANLAPLHPYDKILIMDSNYNKEVSEIINPPKSNIHGAFGDITFIPDEFGYTDENLNPKAKQAIKEQQIPIFRYNTANPNVIDMKFKFGAIYFSQLMKGVTKEVNRKASTAAAGAMATKYANFEFEDRNAVVAFIRKRLYSTGANTQDGEVEKLMTELASRFEGGSDIEGINGSTPEEKAESAYGYYLELLDRPDKPMLKIDQLLPGNPVSIMADFSEQMYRNALQMTIQTLPMFHLSNFSTMSSPCMLFAQSTGIQMTTKNSKEEREHLEKNVMTQFMSGAYKILGWSHEITPKGAQSSFKLVKIRSKQKEKNKKTEMTDQAITGSQSHPYGPQPSQVG